MILLRILAVLLLQAYVACVAAQSTDEATEDALAAVSQRVIVSNSVQGDFRQEKYLSFVDKPFVSTGQFRLERETGLYWHVAEPLESTMLVRDGRVILDGKPVDDQGIGRLMTMLMLGFIEGDLSGLTNTFAVSADTVGADWSLSLKPSSSRLRAAIELIRIQGNQYLSQIEIVDIEHNRTLMQFTNVSAGVQEAELHAEPTR